MTRKVVSAVFCIYFLLHFDTIASTPVSTDSPTTIRAIPLDSVEATSELSTNSTSDAIKSTEATGDDTKLPPLIFPSDTSTYKILPPNHPTTLKFIQMLNTTKDQLVTSTTPLSTTSDSNKNDTKSTTLAEDYYNEDYTEDSHEEDDGGAKVNSSQANIDEVDEMDPMNDEVEEIEDDGDLRPETGLEENFMHSDNLKTNFLEDGENADIEPADSGLAHGHIALMFGGFILLSLTLYLALIYYRNKLEQKYGMRERLVTEDDYYTNSQNDLRYFGL